MRRNHLKYQILGICQHGIGRGRICHTTENTHGVEKTWVILRGERQLLQTGSRSPLLTERNKKKKRTMKTSPWTELPPTCQIGAIFQTSTSYPLSQNTMGWQHRCETLVMEHQNGQGSHSQALAALGSTTVTQKWSWPWRGLLRLWWATIKDPWMSQDNGLQIPTLVPIVLSSMDGETLLTEEIPTLFMPYDKDKNKKKIIMRNWQISHGLKA